MQDKFITVVAEFGDQVIALRCLMKQITDQLALASLLPQSGYSIGNLMKSLESQR